MIKILRQKDILESIIALLKTKYADIKIYTDDTVKAFKQPCFFIKFLKTDSPQTKNFKQVKMDIFITCFVDCEKNRQLEFLDFEDNIAEIFNKGFYVNERYIHIETMDFTRIGEDNDILQTDIAINYLDSFDYDKDAGYDLMQNMLINIKNKYEI